MMTSWSGHTLCARSVSTVSLRSRRRFLVGITTEIENIPDAPGLEELVGIMGVGCWFRVSELQGPLDLCVRTSYPGDDIAVVVLFASALVVRQRLRAWNRF